MLKLNLIWEEFIRFRNMKIIPYDSLGELCRKITLEEYIDKYEENIKRENKRL